MHSKPLVDPELHAFLEAFPPLELSDAVLPGVRAAALPLPARPNQDGADEVDVVTRRVRGPAGAPDVPVTVYRPRISSGTLPCILHIHGGGYVTGSAAVFAALHGPLAAMARCVIVSVDYRLAPETRFPGAIEDCYAALHWLITQAASLGVDAQRVGVMGESAGGGLAAALALLARDRRELTLAFQHLIYPMLDDRTCVTDSPHPYAGEFLWTAHNNRFGWASLLPVAPGSPEVSCYAAAARAPDLSGLPRTFIATGALDLFVEENLEYARRLMRHGVPVELHVYPGAVHCFDLAPDARVARDANRDSLAALKRALHPPAPRPAAAAWAVPDPSAPGNAP